MGILWLFGSLKYLFDNLFAFGCLALVAITWTIIAAIISRHNKEDK